MGVDWDGMVGMFCGEELEMGIWEGVEFRIGGGTGEEGLDVGLDGHFFKCLESPDLRR